MDSKPVRGLSSEAVAHVLRDVGSAVGTRVRLIVARPVPSSSSPATASQIELSRFYSEPHDADVDQLRPQTPNHVIFDPHSTAQHQHNSHSQTSTANNTNSSTTARSGAAPASAPLARRMFYSSISGSMPMPPLPLVPTERLDACVLSISQLLADPCRDTSSFTIPPFANCTVNCNTHNTHQNHANSLTPSPVRSPQNH